MRGDLKCWASIKGFTESHTLLIDVSDFGNGALVEKKLEDANIIVNRNLLPWDIRLGTSEVTCLCVRESEMEEITVFIKRAIIA